MQYAATLPVVGMDIAKNAFQLHVVDNETGEIQRHKLKREKVPVFFANHQRSLIAVEACGGAHHWARTLQSLGHEVKLLPAKHVKPFVLRDKTDARDAQAIWVAAQQRYIKPVPVKSEQQQACLALHRLRAQLMKMRIMQTNGLRGLLYEFGIVLPVGHRVLLQRIQGELAKAQEQGTLPSVLVASVQDQLRRIDGLQEDIDQLDRRLVAMSRQDQHMQALQDIPGIGPLTATALVSTATDIKTFASARQFAAWLGLTPRQTGTGGKTRQLGISKRGDPYVRTMLMHGARAVITRSTQTSWIQRLLQRRPFSVVVAALANKLARTAWAILVKGKAFDQVRWNPTETAIA
jgi:transposase